MFPWRLLLCILTLAGASPAWAWVESASARASAGEMQQACERRVESVMV